MISYESVDKGAAARLSAVAEPIWIGYYDRLLPAGQAEYMYRRFLAPEAVSKSIDEGHSFELVVIDGEDAGFIDTVVREDDLYLSKYYLDERHRGRGFGRMVMDHVCRIAEDSGRAIVRLNVNKDNRTVEIYRRLGFAIEASVTNDIGNGFVMDDYVMVRRI